MRDRLAELLVDAEDRSPEEVRERCEELSLDVQGFNVDESGIAVRAINRS